jgi:hypothetical protein
MHRSRGLLVYRGMHTHTDSPDHEKTATECCTPAEQAACCEPRGKETCCEPEDKATCCDRAPGGCGCR